MHTFASHHYTVNYGHRPTNGSITASYRCNRLRCPLARMSGLQCFNMGHNGHGINLYGVSMTLMGNQHAGGQSSLGHLSLVHRPPPRPLTVLIPGSHRVPPLVSTRRKVLSMSKTFAGSRRVSPAANGPLTCSPIDQRPAVCPHRVPPSARNLPHGGTR